MSSVLHLTWEFPPIVYGGLGRHAEQLVQAQHAAGSLVSVVTAAEDVTDSARRVRSGISVRHGVQVIRAKRPAPRIPWTQLLGAAAQLDDAMAEAGVRQAKVQPPGVVHAHDWIGARAGRRIADLTGARFILTVHATEWGRRHGRLSGGEDDIPITIHELECRAVREADAVIVCSQSMRAEVCDILQADPDRVTVIPNAVDGIAWRCRPDEARTARRGWLAGSTGPLIAAAGRLEWEKGFSTLIRALPDLRAAHPGIRVVLAGRGSYARDLDRLAGELQVDDVITKPGWLGRRDLTALYAAADAVVVPSRYEPSGLVAREAQAAGAPVVATRIGGLPDAVQDGRTGRLIDVGDVHALRDVLLDLIGDPAQARRLATAGSASVARPTWGQIAATTEDLYRNNPETR